jgi:hypothetical protein
MSLTRALSLLPKSLTRADHHRGESPRAVVLSIALLALSTACAETRLYSGMAPGEPPRGYAQHWHTAYAFGLIDGHGEYDLDALCPHGWSEISVAPDLFTVLAGAVTLFVYSPNRLTIVCARAPDPNRPATLRDYPPLPVLP